MARPRIFVSSTYYDLKHVRNNMEEFISSMGYDSIMFENGDIPFHHDIPLDESCYKEIENSHIQILIIGGRYGSRASNDAEVEITQEVRDQFFEKYNSVTQKEYETAREKGIPIFIFVEKGVNAEYQTYKQNRDNKTIRYAHVENVNVFRLLDGILAQRTNNFVKDFENVDDIKLWLKEQWAGLFADFLANKSTEIKLKNLSIEISQLKDINSTLKEYTEAIMRKIKPTNFASIIENEEAKLKTAKIRSFGREPMIRYIREESPLKLTDEQIFSLFDHSDDLESFFANVNLPAKIRTHLMESFFERATQDFEEIKMKYFDILPKVKTRRKKSSAKSPLMRKEIAEKSK